MLIFQTNLYLFRNLVKPIYKYINNYIKFIYKIAYISLFLGLDLCDQKQCNYMLYIYHFMY